MTIHDTLTDRRYSKTDRWLIAAQNGITTIFGRPNGTPRPDPADQIQAKVLMSQSWMKLSVTNRLV